MVQIISKLSKFYAEAIGSKNTFRVTAILPDGTLRKLEGENGMTVRDLVSNSFSEYQIEGDTRIKMADNNAEVDPDADAEDLADGVIMIEAPYCDNDVFDDADGRLRIAKRFLAAEKRYLETIRTISEIYAEPLRKFSSLGKEDHKILFGSMEPVLSVSSTLCSKGMDLFKVKWLVAYTLLGNKLLIDGILVPA
ncbi:unnamed protein product [Owenia fusiformis]|uniref:DH domain-containing protein n=1 Tax=Owenia fusiformis TaxID=6347 RepID=A0A8S4Q1U2_OWEFU|nr:unnamed protein product [Owenia fusiformis]